MTRPVRILAATLLLSMSAIPGILYASVGKAVYVLGTVEVEKPDTQPLRRNTNIDEGDVIVTGERGYAQLLLADGTRIAIRPKSRFVVEALESPAEDGRPAIGAGNIRRANFNLQQGGFRTITGSIAKREPSAYQLRTPSAIIRVRGTDFSTRNCSGGECGEGQQDGVYVQVSEGSISMINDAGELNLDSQQYGYAASPTTPPQRLVAPPAALTSDGLELLIEEDGDGDDEEEGESISESRTASQPGVAGGGTSTNDIVVERPASAAEADAPVQDIVVVSPTGRIISITSPEQAVVRQPISIGGAGEILAVDSNAATNTFGDDSELTGFDLVDSDSEGFLVGTASTFNQGFDPMSELKWGRWSEGVATRLTGDTTSDVDLSSSSLHWIVGPVEAIPDQAITGSANYVLVGNTDPTDMAGNTGVLGSASLSADFTNATVSSSLALGINGTLWSATGTGDININTFQGLYDTVNVSGSNGGSGSFSGLFSDFSGSVPVGAGLNYQLTDGTTTVNGAAIFNAEQ